MEFRGISQSERVLPDRHPGRYELFRGALRGEGACERMRDPLRVFHQSVVLHGQNPEASPDPHQEYRPTHGSSSTATTSKKTGYSTIAHALSCSVSVRDSHHSQESI